MWHNSDIYVSRIDIEREHETINGMLRGNELMPN